MVGRQLPFFSRPRAVLADLGLCRLARHERDLAGHPGGRGQLRDPAIPGLELSTAHGLSTFSPDGVDGLPGCCSCSFWRPAKGLDVADRSRGQEAGLRSHEAAAGARADRRRPESRAPRPQNVINAWIPWMILSVARVRLGLPQFKASGRHLGRADSREGLHNMVERMPPVVAKPTAEAAVYSLNWLSATGSGILLAAIIAGLFMKFSPLGARAQLLDARSCACATRCSRSPAMLALGFHHPLFGRRCDARSRLRECGVGSIRSSGRCWAGSASHSPVPTRRRTCCSAACRRSPPNSSGSVRC